MQAPKLILVITVGVRKIHVWHYVHFSAGLLLKRSLNGGIQFYAWIWPVSGAAFTMYGNPNKVISTGISAQLTFRFTWTA